MSALHNKNVLQFQHIMKMSTTAYENVYKLCRLLYSHTRCSAIAERPRCRVRYSFRQK